MIFITAGFNHPVIPLLPLYNHREMAESTTQTIYDFEIMDIDGRNITLDSFRENVILVVNTASKCGLTPQYEALEALYRKYKDEGLVILGFPCNQFAGQEPGDEESIKNGCLLNYEVTFPMFSKVLVNGKNAHPLYKYLKSAQPGLLGGRIKWNFTKFLIDRNGIPTKRFAPTDKPESIEKHIAALL
jgi:glutathione peroxidase